VDRRHHLLPANVGRQARVLIPKATVKPSTVTRPVAGPLCS
jgi:hypothetical protein